MMLVNGTSAGLAQVLESSGVRFDLQAMGHLGTVSASPWIWLVHKDYPLKTPADFLKAGKEIAWAASGPIDGLSDGALVTCEVLKIKCKVVMGYKGSNDAGLAVTRREMDAIYVSDTSANNYVRSNDMFAVANMSRKRSRFFPDLPTIFDAVKMSQEDAWLMDFHGAMEDLGRILVTPPKMPPARLAYLQGVVKDALADPKLKADGEKSQRYVDYIDAEGTMKAVRAAITDITPEQKKRVQTLLNAK
jgi:tripartite-type tricarboxylate transporter receptor subunit TctC